MSINVDKKSARGRPRVDSEIVTARVGRVLLEALDAWRDRQLGPKPTRPEAVRAALKDWLTREGLLGTDMDGGTDQRG